MIYDGTEEQRANLLKLAEFLEGLPFDYNHFDMSTYASHSGCDVVIDRPEREVAFRPKAFFKHCGTVACAIGHGPAAGIKVRNNANRLGIDWLNYGKRAFGVSSDIYYFLFAGIWPAVDPHHWGAAARIRYILAGNDVPEDFCITDGSDLIYSYYLKPAPELA